MPASARSIAASALAVFSALTASPAAAADLYEPPYEEYGEEAPPPPRYRFAAGPDDFQPPYPPERIYGRGCIPREVARDRLVEAGWYDFHGLEPRDSVVFVKARRPSGRLFDLTIDRCSGEIVDARPLYDGGGRYAWGPRHPHHHRHWERY